MNCIVLWLTGALSALCLTVLRCDWTVSSPVPSGCQVTPESGGGGSGRGSVSSVQSGGRRDTGASLDSVGASSGSLSPLEPPSPLFPPDSHGGEISLTSEVFLNVIKLHQNRKKQENRNGTAPRDRAILLWVAITALI